MEIIGFISGIFVRLQFFSKVKYWSNVFLMLYPCSRAAGEAVDCNCCLKSALQAAGGCACQKCSSLSQDVHGDPPPTQLQPEGRRVQALGPALPARHGLVLRKS